MASDPAHALQKAVYGALRHIADGRVYHTVPAKTPTPYLVIGDDTIIADDDAADMSDCTVVVNIVASNKPDAKLLSSQVRTALNVALAVEGFITVEYGFEEARHMTQKDGLTQLAVMDFRFLLMPAA